MKFRPGPYSHRSAAQLAASLCILALCCVAGSRAAAQSNTQNIGSSTAAAAQQQAAASGTEHPVRSVPDPGAITTNQVISPAGVQSVFESRVYGIAFGDSSSQVYAATTSKGGAMVYRLDWASNTVLDRLRNPAAPWHAVHHLRPHAPHGRDDCHQQGRRLAGSLLEQRRRSEPAYPWHQRSRWRGHFARRSARPALRRRRAHLQ